MLVDDVIKVHIFQFDESLLRHCVCYSCSKSQCNKCCDCCRVRITCNVLHTKICINPYYDGKVVCMSYDESLHHKWWQRSELSIQLPKMQFLGIVSYY